MSLPAHNLQAVEAVQAYLKRTTPNYAQAYGSLPEALVVVSADRHLAYVNTAFCDLFGYSESELIGQHAGLLYVSQREFDQSSQNYFESGIMNDTIGLLLVSYQKRSGEVFCGSSAPSALYDGDTLVGFLGIIRDITEAMRTRQELALASSQLRAVFNAIPRALFFTSTDRKIQMANPAAERLFGYTADELVGLSTKELLPSVDDFKTLGQQRINANMPNAQLPFIQEFVRKDGETFVGEGLTGRITDDHDNNIGFVGIVADVSNQKERVTMLKELNARLEENVVERTAALEVSNRELRAFAYSVSHDLGAPLRAIRNYADFIRQDNAETLSAESLEYLKYIDDNAAYIDRLTQDLLEYSRIGRRVLELEEIPMQPFLSGLVDRLNLDQNAAIRIDENLPTITADYALLEQIFSNLLTNAVMYVPARRRPVIRVTCQADQTHWGFIVQDNGIGIAPQHLTRVFGIFERLHLQSEFPGTGIGLAIVKRAAEYLGGSASVNSTVDVGSLFKVTLSKTLSSTDE